MRKPDLGALASKVIDRHGGCRAVADKLGYTPHRVRHWRRSGVPLRQVRAVCAQLDVRPCLIRPDFYGQDVMRPEP